MILTMMMVSRQSLSIKLLLQPVQLLMKILGAKNRRKNQKYLKDPRIKKKIISSKQTLHHLKKKMKTTMKMRIVRLQQLS